MKQRIYFNTLLLCATIYLVATRVEAQSITKLQIHNNAVPFTTYTFTAASSNIQYSVNCSSVGDINTPSWVAVGANTVGMPYCWGGFSTEASFTSGLLAGHSAGDNDCTTSGDCCENCALGVDCSGFVSHAWGQSTKYSTNTLPSISTQYSSAMDVEQGDIFNLAGSHTRLVDENYGSGTFLIMESSGADWKVSYRAYTASQLTSYTPRWYVNIDTADTPCRHKYYASLPYATSFENNWILDSCTNESQKLPDKYWKCSINADSGSIGDDYWHRNDYTGPEWDGYTSGAYSPVASVGSYSARFHNDPPPAGSSGNLDLYVNLSTPGTKQVSFDYIHAESAPAPFAFNVLLSTDGGSTFPTTLYSITTAQFSSWTTQTFTTSATTATGVLRFTVVDKGTHDVGIDNLNITALGTTGISSANTNQDNITVYPNPAVDGSFVVKTDGIDKGWAMDVFNSLGQFVLHKEPAQGQNEVLVNGLSKGIYFINVFSNGISAGVKKVVVTE